LFERCKGLYRTRILAVWTVFIAFGRLGTGRVGRAELVRSVRLFSSKPLHAVRPEIRQRQRCDLPNAPLANARQILADPQLFERSAESKRYRRISSPNLSRLHGAAHRLSEIDEFRFAVLGVAMLIGRNFLADCGDTVY